jgi:sn-glycerol 3-phosphate transport system permease protein
MQQPIRDPRIERLFTVLSWGALTAAVLFLVGFFLLNLNGLRDFGTWLSNGIGLLPDALTRVTAHYNALPLMQWLPSLIIGGLVGTIGTVLVMRRVVLWQIVVGAMIGIPFSQLLTLTTQHCTYASEVPFGTVLVSVGLTLVGALLGLLPFWFALRTGLGKSQFVAGYFRNRWLPYLFLLPTGISLLLFLYYPSLQTLILSLFNKRFPLPQERFVCLDNYGSLVSDPIYQNSFLTSLVMTALIVLIAMSLSLSIAVLVSQKIKFASVYRTFLIWPFALSPVVAGAIFLTMFREGQTGLINAFVYSLTGTTLSWLRDVDLARVSIVAASVWNILGFNVLFYVAGLQNVPADVLEAAEIDGANRVQRFWRVTFPLLAPFSFFLLVTNVSYSFYGIYGAVDTLTSGGPPLGAAGNMGGATNVLIYKLYQDAFTPGSPLGLAGAQAVILFLMVAGITLLQFRAIESRITYGE